MEYHDLGGLGCGFISTLMSSAHLLFSTCYKVTNGLKPSEHAQFGPMWYISGLCGFGWARSSPYGAYKGCSWARLEVWVCGLCPIKTHVGFPIGGQCGFTQLGPIKATIGLGQALMDPMRAATGLCWKCEYVGSAQLWPMWVCPNGYHVGLPIWDLWWAQLGYAASVSMWVRPKCDPCGFARRGTVLVCKWAASLGPIWVTPNGTRLILSTQATKDPSGLAHSS